MSELPKRPLGPQPDSTDGSADGGLSVSVMSLGSWRTFEHITEEEGLAVMTAARAAGITFLDDARYDDETGTAPIPTGYSEVIFGELFRAAGWQRDEVTVSNKLWWEHWPSEDAAAELAGSLGRMKFDHIDLIYAMPPPDGMSMETLVEQVAALIDRGVARAWGTGMWTAAQHHQALDICQQHGAPAPVAAQMANSLIHNDGPADPEMIRAFERGPIGLVASYVLAGGTLTGKYLEPDASGRAADDDTAGHADGKRAAADVVRLATEWGVPPAHVAFAYAFSHPHLASILFGARSPEQLNHNVGAYATFAQLDDDQRAAIAAIAVGPQTT
jgi:aryl-alcohol dehydrogenase-like predicted oxidoreductase